MKVLVTGGAGFLGARLARQLLRNGQLEGQTIDELVVADLAAPPADLLADERVRALTGLIINQCPALSGSKLDVVFHLAAAVSAECEADFDLGMRSNLDTTRALLDALRTAGNVPRFIFASSLAVFGADPGLPMPPLVRADTLPMPQSSYGIQKFICEQLVADYTRKGFIDGRSVRLMTVVVRPGRPNGAASGFLSAIIREPVHGQPAVCPVPAETKVALASPGRTIHGLIAVAESPRAALRGRIAINLPGLTVSVAEMLNALEAECGSGARALVRFEPDATTARIVGGWPCAFDNSRAQVLGLDPDPDFISIVREFLKDRAMGAPTCS